MIDFDKKIKNTRITLREEIDTENFVQGVNDRIIKSEKNRMSTYATFILLFFLTVLTFTDFKNIGIDTKFFTNKENESFQDTYWSLGSDSIRIDSSYINEITYFIVEEGDLWGTLDFFNEIKINKESES